jgi:hypothetical protein
MLNTKTGEILPRRQYEKLVTAAGTRKPISPQQYTAFTRGYRQYRQIVEDYVKFEKSKGNSIKIGDARKSPEIKLVITDLRTRKPDRMKRALTFIGRRQGIPDWVPVGQSDAYRQGNLKAPVSRSAGSRARRANKG